MRATARTRVHRSRRERREGMVMLIVLLIILMATSTAVFSIQDTAFETRAAGAMYRAASARAAAEGGAAVVQGLADRRLLDGQSSLDNFDGMRNQFCLPSRAASPATTLMSVTDASAGTDNAYLLKFDDPSTPPADSVVEVVDNPHLSGWNGGFGAMVEKWILDEQRDSNGVVVSYTYRWVTTTYGGYAPQMPFRGVGATPSDPRGLHEAVSVMQSQYDEQL